ncbi:MAG: sigma-70 family RNA polymerase sigma factor [Chloroflexi bacterium]|nr:sigma-70 family RNA polymerase sigma factor [Chloroflexota bacterium]MBI4504045.1 sigma-70 family RNA polymerase sigma factor [Chloroflexota bacterium]
MVGRARTPVNQARRQDEELAARLAARDALALTELYQRHSRAVYSLALRMLGDREAADELVQDVFLRVWHHPERYLADRGRFVTWLLSVAHHRAVDLLRRRRVQRPTADGDVAELSADSVAPDDAVADAEERRAVRDALATLPEGQRRSLELAYFEGLTQSEIAARLGEPLGTIKTRIRLGMLKLREQLRGLVREYEAG